MLVQVCQKIADATKIPLDYLQKLSYAELEGFFDQIDTDMWAPLFFHVYKLMIESTGEVSAWALAGAPL